MWCGCAQSLPHLENAKAVTTQVEKSRFFHLAIPHLCNLLKLFAPLFPHCAFQKAFMLPAPPCDAYSLSLLLSVAPQQKCAQHAQSHRRRQRKRSCRLQRIKEYESKQLRQHPEQRRAGKHHLCSAARFCACCHTARKRRQRGRRRCCNAYSALPYRAVLDRRRFKRKQRQLRRQPR